MATKAKSEKPKAEKAEKAKSPKGPESKRQGGTKGSPVEALRGREDKELNFDAEALRKERFELHFKGVSEGLKNPARLGDIRRQIARIQTVLNERKHSIRGQASR